MEICDPLEDAQRIAEQAIRAMARHEVPPNPANFALWYCHCAGTWPDLSKALAALEQGGGPISEARCAELHGRFFGNGRQVRLLDETCRRVEAAIGNLLHHVARLTDETGSYGEKLRTFGHELAAPAELRAIRDLVGGIRADTRAMQERTRQLEVEFSYSSEQIAGLREDLASAQREAMTDSLTGVANRKHFDLALRRALAHATRAGEPVSLLLGDIDHFKDFNDSYGHQVGDRVLRTVAQIFLRCVKGRDLVARYGGEEFVVILPQTDLTGATTVAEQIRRFTAASRVRLKASGRSLGVITLSLGCAQFDPGESPTRLIRRADEALYAAKRAGRNRVASVPAPGMPARAS